MAMKRSFHHFVTVFMAGWIILLGAIVLNAIASLLGLASWYEVLSNMDTSKLMWVDYVWLLILYPLGLGGLVVVASRAVSWYNHRFVVRKR